MRWKPYVSLTLLPVRHEVMSLDFLQQQVSTALGTARSVTSLQTKLQWAAPTRIVGDSKSSLDFPMNKKTLKAEI